MRTGFTAASLPFRPVRPGQKGLVWEEIGAQPFAQQLERMAGQDAVLWSAQELEFAEAESRLYHGGMYRLCRTDVRQGFAICTVIQRTR